ncbi:MAG TPA: hypothetical protein VFF70_06755 [Anaerolineae bacterium]|nr:hypothetical protein [Anaerolineae bacterium]
MNLTTTTGIALILSTLIYHGGLAYLFARAQFEEWLNLPQRSYREKLLIIARHPEEYRWGFRIILIGWIVAALGYVMLTVLLRDAGDPIISTLASVLFLMGIVSAIAFWALSLTANVLAAEHTARTTIVPEYYEVLEMSAESLLGVYQLLALLATAGFGWALLQTGILPSWVGWVTIGWGLLWAGVHLRSDETIPLLPMVMQVVIGISVLLK